MIPIACPLLGKEELGEVRSGFGSPILTNGEKTRRFEAEFAKYIGTKYAVATNSGTAALHVALLALGIRPGDEVITSPFSFIATANAIVYCKARPVFADIDLRTFNLDPREVERRITARTKAILAVHLFGLPCDMKALNEIAQEHDLYLVEDACQAHGAMFAGRKVGGLGDVGCFSFYPTKNMTTGEGGMITLNNDKLAHTCRMLVNQGQAERYHHRLLGFNYRMTEFSAAIGIAQLRKLDIFVKRRRDNAAYYDSVLSEKFVIPFVPKGYFHAYNQYTLRVEGRDHIVERLAKRGIGYGMYYPRIIPEQPIYASVQKKEFLNSLRAAREVLSIPVHPGLSDTDRETVARALLEAGS